jgi:hypothetical protein
VTTANTSTSTGGGGNNGGGDFKMPVWGYGTDFSRVFLIGNAFMQSGSHFVFHGGAVISTHRG